MVDVSEYRVSRVPGIRPRSFFTPHWSMNSNKQSRLTCTTDLQQFITGRPRQIAILNCMSLNGYIVVNWSKREVICVNRSYMGVVKFPSLNFSRFSYIKTNILCTKVYDSILHTPYSCYMFRPLMLPSAKRCITKDITEVSELMQRYKVINFKMYRQFKIHKKI
jgi:hypothetical protein